MLMPDVDSGKFLYFQLVTDYYMVFSRFLCGISVLANWYLAGGGSCVCRHINKSPKGPTLALPRVHEKARKAKGKLRPAGWLAIV